MTVCAELQRRFLLVANRFAVRTARMKLEPKEDGPGLERHLAEPFVLSCG